VSATKKLLIITDGAETIQLYAQSIKKALIDYDIKICPSDKFSGTDILPVQVFLLGCEKSNPASFAYLTEMLSHINLAGRKCGIFSTNEKTLAYLNRIVKDCEASLAEPLLINNDGKVQQPILKKWLKKIVSN